MSLPSSIFSYFSRTSKVLDSSKYVGVMDCHTDDNTLPFRIFYPVCDKSDSSGKRGVGWFVRSLAYFLDGYIHFLFPKMRQSGLYIWLVSVLSVVVSLFMPMANIDLPMCKYDAALPSDQKFPLLVFSHGLTGTGEESALTFAYWAQQGFIVGECEGP